MVICGSKYTLFYDEEYGEIFKENKKEIFNKYFANEKWRIVFHKDITYKLEELGLIEKICIE